MAFLELRYHSDTLKQGVSVNVILPERAKTMIGMDTNASGTYKTLYLLHGLSDDHTIWMRRTSIERYAADYGIAVVMPEVGRSWYTNTAYGVNYFSFIADELPSVCRGFFRGMSDKREDNMVAGLSMGGYGAFKWAFNRPDFFNAAANLSGVSFIIDLLGNEAVADEVNGECGIVALNWGSIEELKGSDSDSKEWIDKAVRENIKLPKLFAAVGTEDASYEYTQKYLAYCKGQGVDIHYEEMSGGHEWKVWNEMIDRFIKFYFE